MQAKTKPCLADKSIKSAVKSDQARDQHSGAEHERCQAPSKPMECNSHEETSCDNQRRDQQCAKSRSIGQVEICRYTLGGKQQLCPGYRTFEDVRAAQCPIL